MFWMLSLIRLKLAEGRGKWKGMKQKDVKERGGKDSRRVTWQVATSWEMSQ